MSFQGILFENPDHGAGGQAPAMPAFFGDLNLDQIVAAAIANPCAGLFTHYGREEDSAMKSGKFDEELRRTSDVVDHIRPDSLLLCNESFASTNEREGSEIARQIVRALLEKRIRIFFVTHFYELADALRRDQTLAVVFLRADRQPDGRRTFKLVAGAPLATGHGQDLYDRVFGTADQPAAIRSGKSA